MNPDCAIDAMRLFDPAFASERGIELIRSVLDQARTQPLLAGSTVQPSSDEKRRLSSLHRVGPLVARLHPTPDAQLMVRELTYSQLRLVGVAQRISAALAEAGIETRVLKGLATSQIDYPSPALRHSGDVDLLLRLPDLRRAVGILSASCCNEPDASVARPELLKGQVLEHERDIEIDLHYRLSRFARNSGDDVLFDDPQTLTGGMLALPAEGRLIHAASHALSPNPSRRLSSVADIVALIDNTGVNWDRLGDLARRVGLADIVAAAFRAEAALMDRPPHPGMRLGSMSALRRRALLTSKKHPLTEHWLASSALPDGAGRLEYVRHRVLPSAGLVHERGGRMAHYRHLARRLRA